MLITLDHALPSGRTLGQLAEACDEPEDDHVSITGPDLIAILDLSGSDDEPNVTLRRFAATATDEHLTVDAGDVQAIVEEALITSVITDPAAQPHLADRIGAALDVALSYGWYDGEQHKQHALDQIVQLLAGYDGYQLLMATNPGWDEGTPA